MKKFGLLLLIACMAVMLTAVPGWSSGEESPMAMRVVYTPFDFTLDFVVALDKGLFKKAGITLEQVTVQGGSANIISTLHRGEIDGCFLASSSALVARGRGIGLVQVAGIGVQEFEFYALKDSPINSINDFTGKKVATFPKPSGPWLGPGKRWPLFPNPVAPGWPSSTIWTSSA